MGKILTIEQKRELRRKSTAEVFTPESLARQMLDKIPEEVWKDSSKTLLEPSCGDGIFVCLSIRKRLSFGVSIEDAIRNTYALDIMDDNIRECRLNVFEIIRDQMKLAIKSDQLTEKEAYQRTVLLTAILFHNVRTTKDTLAEDFDSWKTYDEEAESVKKKFLEMAKKSIPIAVNKLEEKSKVIPVIDKKEDTKIKTVKEVLPKKKMKKEDRPIPDIKKAVEQVKEFVSMENLF